MSLGHWVPVDNTYSLKTSSVPCELTKLTQLPTGSQASTLSTEKLSLASYKLSCLSISVKGHHDKHTTYERKDLIGSLLIVAKSEPRSRQSDMVLEK